MRVIVAGSRDINDYKILQEAIKESGFTIKTVISGGAKGVDEMGERYAKEFNLNLEVFKADWKKYGRGAGPIRNKKMAENADALIALWDSKSAGTKNTIDISKKMGLSVFVKIV